MDNTGLVSNILIAGKTGVGKSAFLNYIYGRDIAASRAGSPVTEEGLHEYEYYDLERGILFRFFDTWGLEADRSDEWHEAVLAVVNEREGALDIADWFHTIYYLLSINSGRVEAYEIDAILRPLYEKESNVTIILTSYNPESAMNVEKAEAMESVLMRELGIPREAMIRVNSVEKKLLSGQLVPRLGYDAVWTRNRVNLWQDVERKLPLNLTNHLLGELEAWRDRSHRVAESIRIFTPQAMISWKARQIEKDLEATLEAAAETTEEAMAEGIRHYIQLMERYPLVGAPSDLVFKTRRVELGFDYSFKRTIRKMVLGMIPGVHFIYWAFKRRTAERGIKKAVNQQYEVVKQTIEFDVRRGFEEEMRRLGRTLSQ
ncbi:GTPase [Exiguobacterium alkaliphilum]|uniref:GTPase domain-containing protein n=1 Tax=Exiguobacterium alkaliphilum TaxID=1428684 RepID=A0ABT2KYJ7_9BACL|nr:GTPase domain-containing protein [Exiguobacterium alkaliphilum]MCT4795509.1 GTPase domain-containing protein [Exiguobacterium alkaliphilum]